MLHNVPAALVGSNVVHKLDRLRSIEPGLHLHNVHYEMITCSPETCTPAATHLHWRMAQIVELDPVEGFGCSLSISLEGA